MNSHDTASIIAVVNSYALAVDAQCWVLFDQAFTSDFEADFGGAAVWRGLVALKRDFEAIHSPFDATQHVTTKQRPCARRYGALPELCARPLHSAVAPTETCSSQPAGMTIAWRAPTPDGGSRIACVVWCWGGNPRVLETMEGIKVERTLNSLRSDARAGRLAYLRALRAKI